MPAIGAQISVLSLKKKLLQLSHLFTNPVGAMQFSQLYRFVMLFLTGLVLARLGVPTAVIGVYETLLFLSSAFSFFWLNGLLQNLLVQYPQTKNKNLLLQNTFWCLTAFRLVAFIAYLLLVFKLYPELEQDIYHWPTQIFALVIFFAGAGLMAEYIFLVKGQAGYLSVFSAVHYTAHLVVVALSFAWGLGLEEAVYGLVILNLARVLFVLYLLFGQKFSWPDKAIIKQLLLHTSPLMMAALLSGSIEYISGFYVSSYMGDADFAVYRYGAKELPLTLLLANAFSNAVIPKVSGSRDHIGEALHYIKKQSFVYMKWLFPLSIVLMPIGKYLYPALFNPDFAGSAIVFNIFLLMVISRFAFPQTILMGLGHRRIIMVGSVIEVVSCIVLLILLGALWGTAGIAAAIVLAAFIEKAYLALTLYQLEKISPSQYINLQGLVSLSVMLLLAFVVIQFLLPAN